jgi:hypothetical protein
MEMDMSDKNDDTLLTPVVVTGSMWLSPSTRPSHEQAILS